VWFLSSINKVKQVNIAFELYWLFKRFSKHRKYLLAQLGWLAYILSNKHYLGLVFIMLISNCALGIQILNGAFLNFSSNLTSTHTVLFANADGDKAFISSIPTASSRYPHSLEHWILRGGRDVTASYSQESQSQSKLSYSQPVYIYYIHIWGNFSNFADGILGDAEEGLLGAL